MLNLRIARGRCLPLGTMATPDGINFALLSCHATDVTLVLYAIDGKEVISEIALHNRRNRTGQHWHVLVQGLPPADESGSSHSSSAKLLNQLKWNFLHAMGIPRAARLASHDRHDRDVSCPSPLASLGRANTGAAQWTRMMRNAWASVMRASQRRPIVAEPSKALAKARLPRPGADLGPPTMRFPPT